MKIFLLLILILACEYEKEFKNIVEIVREKKENKGTFFKKMQLYVVAVMNTREVKDLEICDKCYKRLIFDAEVHESLSLCDKIVVNENDSFYYFSSQDEQNKYYFLVVSNALDSYFLGLKNDKLVLYDCLKQKTENSKVMIYEETLKSIDYSLVGGLEHIKKLDLSNVYFVTNIVSMIKSEKKRGASFMSYSNSFKNLYLSDVDHVSLLVNGSRVLEENEEETSKSNKLDVLMNFVTSVRSSSTLGTF